MATVPLAVAVNGDVVLPLVLPGKGIRLGRRRGDGLISTG